MFFIPVEHVEMAWVSPYSEEILGVIASIVKIPTERKVEEQDPPYPQLPLSEQDRDHIEWIITTIAENGKLTLLVKYKGKLEGRGAQINHVHPLKFLAAIFNPQKPHLRSCMAEIAKDSFKWDGVMKGIRPSLSRESDRGKLDTLIEEFAQEVGVPSALIRPYFQSRDWDGLVQRLISG